MCSPVLFLPVWREPNRGLLSPNDSASEVIRLGSIFMRPRLAWNRVVLA